MGDCKYFPRKSEAMKERMKVYIVTCVKRMMNECSAGFECNCDEKDLNVILVTTNFVEAQKARDEHIDLSKEHFNFLWVNINEYELEKITHRYEYTGMLMD
jgi:hypothetical protein